MQKWIKPFGFLILLILICSALARIIGGRSETLADYARKNPPALAASPRATKTPEKTAAPAPSTAQSSTPSPSAVPQTTPDLPKFTPLCEESEESVHYQDGFFYQPLTDPVIAKITGISYPVSEAVAPALAQTAVNLIGAGETPAVSLEELRYMNVLYYDFEGEIKIGELICNRGIADDLMEIFYELYLNEYRIERIRLIDEYGGDDTASMEDNNTSCFNYRVVDGTASLSKHALGCAIDINPFYNPYVVYNRDGSGETYISPGGSEIYADRSRNFPYKIDESDLCYQLFKEHGFTWGGSWNSSKDYQHFQKVVVE